MSDFIRRSAEEPTNPHHFSAAVLMSGAGAGGGGGLTGDERPSTHDLSSLKQRFAQLTTF